MIYEKAKAALKRIEKQINAIHIQLKKLPSGNFFCTRNGHLYKWYQTDGKEQTYIPKKHRALAEKLALKKYLTLLLNDLEKEKSAINFYLRHHKNDYGEAAHLLINHPEYQKLLTSFLRPVNQELSDWMTASYHKSQKYPEQLTHKTSTGSFVRSKSEVIISLMLHTNRIPFRYECALNLNGIVIFPDFTIRHPRTRELFYWEHFGMMDDPSYARSTFSKLQLYTSHGIIPSINLIATYETKEYPLNTTLVENIINEYFLDS